MRYSTFIALASATMTLLSLTACGHRDAVAVEKTNANQTEPNPPSRGDSLTKIDLLAVDADGCKIKRFDDGLNAHYYVVCPNSTASTISYVSCGKGCTRPDEIPTLSEPPQPRTESVDRP